MQATSEQIKLSVDGKWISLARNWLEKNTPCTKEHMFVCLGKIMPGTIRLVSNGQLAEKHQLVRASYYRIYKTASIPDLILPPPELRTSKSREGTVTHSIRAAIKDKETFTEDYINQCVTSSTPEKIRKLLFYLIKRGEIKRIDDFSYQVIRVME